MEIKDGRIVIHKKNEICIGKKLYSKNYSYFKIIEKADKTKNGSYLYNIQFLNTNYIKQNVRKDHIKDGTVKDDTFNKPSIIGKTFESKTSGKFIVIRETYRTKHNIKYEICFYKTNYITEAWETSINIGEVKDPTYPVIAGIGYLGINYKKYKKDDKELFESLYNRWSPMLHRCYNNKSKKYNWYGKLGIKVDKRWHDFSKYFIDVQKLPGYDREKVLSGELQLDKDKFQIYKAPDNKVYSKDTCCWLSAKENTKLINKDQISKTFNDYPS